MPQRYSQRTQLGYGFGGLGGSLSPFCPFAQMKQDLLKPESEEGLREFRRPEKDDHGTPDNDEEECPAVANVEAPENRYGPTQGSTCLEGVSSHAVPRLHSLQ